MARIPFKGSGYTGEQDVIFVTKFVVGPMPPRARLFDPVVLKAACKEFHEAAQSYLACQDYLKEGPPAQSLIPEVVLPDPLKLQKPPMECLTWFTGFRLLNNELVFEAEVRTSEKLPTKARKAIGDTLSRSFKALIGNIERKGGVPGDLAPAETLVTPKPPDQAPGANSEIPEIP